MDLVAWEKLKIRISAVLWFVLGVGFLISLPIIFGWSAWAFVAILASAAFLALPTAWLVGLAGHFRAFSRRWLKAGLAWLFLLSIMVAAPIYYLAFVTELRPALVPQATLTNGSKTVVFQGMMHVGSENFYKSVVYDIEKALSDGHVIYYEAVQTATPEAKEFFAKLTAALTSGNADLSASYKALAETCGLKFQSDYFELLERDKKEHPERHVNADVDAIDMKREYERLVKSDPSFAKEHAKYFETPARGAPIDATLMQGAVSWATSGPDKRTSLIGVACRGYLSLAFAPKDEEKSTPFQPIILDFRNRALAQRIVDDPREKIFITYGARHLSGVIELLKNHDLAWRVASLKWIRTIEAPRKQFAGDLR